MSTSPKSFKHTMPPSSKFIADPNAIPSTQTLYMPIMPPPTPAPSPRPPSHNIAFFQPHGLPFSPMPESPTLRRQYLTDILANCTRHELLYISTAIAPLLKRDFLYSLPPELAMNVLAFIDDPRTLARTSQVSRYWKGLVEDEWIWRRMCVAYGFDEWDQAKIDAKGKARARDEEEDEDEPLEEMEQYADFPMDPALEWYSARKRKHRRQQGLYPRLPHQTGFSCRRHFRDSYITMMNWRNGGELLRSHRYPIVTPDSGVITSLALDNDWVIVGLANSKIHVFSARTGVLARTLVGHDSGVWAVSLVSRGGWRAPEPPREDVGADGRRSRRGDDTLRGLSDGLAGMNVNGPRRPLDGLDHLVPSALRTALGLPNNDDGVLDEDAEYERMSAHGAPSPRSDVCCASQGWGQPNSLVVSGGCDKVLKVWDIKSGYCIYTLPGHTSTIRCIRVLHNRPIAVTGSRDSTLGVWDLQRGKVLRVLAGHTQSVRCLDVCGNKVVSGSYDTTCRLWDIDTGRCIHILRGHNYQIYSVAFDGVRIASGGLDTTVRVWDAASGQCTAHLLGHTALVCQLQLSPTILATGGSDGRVITFSLSTYSVLHRIAAHDSSVTSLQFDRDFLVTGGNDGRVRLYETETGNYVRDLSEPSESVWKVAYGRETCAVMCKRAGKTVMEVWSLRPRGDQC